ncbi:ABC transporter ATP-binding protein [Labrys wisconsinensis]|uniref:Spermidine/putrescine transport system ATP-binding protein n=1 Tax=Labrys wisconsinensis TaxID=425677 RepID=A0ABU0J0L7_9HYPH|nr:ABC transporter ATP-binding protein [Labrys wisconsinensis]MDQ0467812.1 putative spermidine/putrescine transport system ATP-binding protein [Labrys wisconsinensis]
MAIAASRFETLALEGVGRSFGHHNALAGVDLTIRRGEFVALLGPSGCGKSTTLNCIAGLLAISAGRILLDGRRIDPLRPEERGFGMVFQNYALFPHLSVRQNVGFGLKMRGVGREETRRRVEEAIRLVRLGGQEEKLPGQLSGGQQQRVAIARAVVIEPPLVLMDEPLSNLDAKLRLEMRAEIRRIHNTLGATTIYVTHDQDEALSLADRIVVLRDGVIRQVGTPRELYETPADVDVAEFMGFRNAVPGTWRAGAGGETRIEAAEAVLTGRAQGALADGAPVLAVFRPDDLVAGPASAGGIPAVVETMEYRGREFVGSARTPGGLSLVFRAETPAEVGAAIALVPDPAKVLVFPRTGGPR